MGERLLCKQEAAGSTPVGSTTSTPRVARLGKDSLDFSFSGVKTALLYHLRGNALTRPMPELTTAQVSDLAASYQEAIVDILVDKLRLAARQTGARSLAIGGGVARNVLLRERIASDDTLRVLELVFPPMDLCSDNGAMIAGLGTELLRQGRVSDLDVDAVATTRAHPRKTTA